jgi:hypothetical protein
MANFAEPLAPAWPARTTARSSDARTQARARELITASNKVLNRFNHCRPAAIEVMESLVENWPDTPADLADVVAQIMGRKTRRLS